MISEYLSRTRRVTIDIHQIDIGTIDTASSQLRYCYRCRYYSNNTMVDEQYLDDLELAENLAEDFCSDDPFQPFW